VRLIVAALLVGFVVAGVGDGWWSSPSAEPVVQSFLLDWQDHAYAAAAALTTGQPAEVTTELDGAFHGLDAASYTLSMGYISQNGKTATAHFQADVDLGQIGEPWVYQGEFGLHLTGSGWKIDWSPSVINPALRRGVQLAVVSSTQPRMPLLDAQGHPLQTLSPVVVAGVRGHVKSPLATADALGRVTKIAPTEIEGWIVAAPREKFQELVTMQPAYYRRVAHALRKVPDLIVLHKRIRLFDSTAPVVVGTVGTETSRQLRDQGIAYRPGATVGLGGLQYHYNSYLAGTPTTEVVTETASGHQVRVLKTWKGHSPAAVHTTIDARVQRAAARAVRSAPGSAAIVAMQASTGHILAVAEHTGRRMTPIYPLAGHYPPGGAFTIVSTEALLASGVQLNTEVPCPSANLLDGRNFKNIPPLRQKTGTFAADFARSCSTALAAVSLQKGLRKALANAARGFGLGAIWSLPLPSFSGQMVVPGAEPQLASVTIGQSGVMVSPLTMAAVAAQVDTGVWRSPSLVTQPDPQHEQQVRFSASTMTSLRNLMREAVRSGAARRADVRGNPVHGQVGTVQIGGPGRHQRWAAWFVGYRGDVAFAVLEVSGSPRVSAARLAASVLRAAPGR
jgi:hypothetical protein